MKDIRRIKALIGLAAVIVLITSVLPVIGNPSEIAITGSQQSISERWVLRVDQQAERWEDALVTGNGRHGTMVMGNQSSLERITNVHEELWLRAWDRSIVGVPYIAEHLPQMRQLIAEGKNNSAFFVYQHAMDQARAMGAADVWECTPHPAFDLIIDHGTTGALNTYSNQLDIETGEVFTRWHRTNTVLEQRVFSSRQENVNVVSLKSTRGQKLNLTLALKETPGREGMHLGEYNLDDAMKSVATDAEPGWLSFHANYQIDQGGYEGLARVTLKGGTMVRDGSVLTIANADEVLVLIRITPLEDGSQTLREGVKSELAAMSEDYGALFLPHAEEHGEMFHRVTLDLGAEQEWKATTTPEMLQKVARNGVNAHYLEAVHAMGRYLLISSSGRYPPPLRGIWGGDWKAEWAGGFVLDSNLDLAISAGGMGNLPETVESYAGFVERLLPGWRLNAKRTLGTRGFLAANFAHPETGYLAHKNPSSWYYICQAGWHIRPLYDYALLAGDREFMEQRVLPLYLEMADFYEDYFVEGESGTLHLSPSTSPENAVVPPDGMHTQMADDSTIDIAVAREVYQILIELGQQFGLPQAKIAEWQNVRERIAPYRINQDGALAEWAPEKYPETYGHRHNSHLYPIFPGYELFQEDSPRELLDAAHVALQKRIETEHLRFYEELSGHGIMYAAQMAARLRDVSNVQAMIHQISDNAFYYNSMVSSHCPNGLYYNLDVALSFPRLLMEMAVFSHPGNIDLMPGWYSQLPDGSLGGVLVRGGHKIDLAWAGGRMTSALLHAGAAETLAVSFGDQSHAIAVKAGQQYQLAELFNELELAIAPSAPSALEPGLSNPSKNSSAPSETIEASVDGKPETKWCVHHNGRPVVWQMSFEETPSTALRSYSLTSANDVPDRDPIRWRLEGSNNGVEWALLDQRDLGDPFAKRLMKKPFRIERGPVFQAYRFVFEPVDATHFQVADIELNFGR